MCELVGIVSDAVWFETITNGNQNVTSTSTGDDGNGNGNGDSPIQQQELENDVALLSSIGGGSQRRVDAGYSQPTLYISENALLDTNTTVMASLRKTVHLQTTTTPQSMDTHVLQSERTTPALAGSITEFRLLLKELCHELGITTDMSETVMKDNSVKQDAEDNAIHVDDQTTRPTDSAKNNVTTTTTSTDSSNAETIRLALEDAHGRIDALQKEQEEIWLDAGGKVPLLQFGNECNKILTSFLAASNQNENDVDPSLSSEQRDALTVVLTRLQRLFEYQLSSLRDHYGSVYENALAANPTNERAQTVAAQKATENFRAAAQQAVPLLCRSNGGSVLYQNDLLSSGFDYVMALQGLIQDMMDATALLQDDMATAAAALEDNEEDTGSNDDNGHGRFLGRIRIPQWCKTMAARAVMFGVNYLQGWLAWQGIKRAAEKRDKNMPKFPLF